MPASGSPRIRVLQPDDHEAWLLLFRAYLLFYEADLPEVTIDATWKRLLDPNEPMGGALAIEGQRAIGLAHWIFHRSCWIVSDSCYLQDLFVTGDARGRGVGRSLIDHVSQVARGAGCPRIHWLTHETNTTAMQLYDRIGSRTGFVQYERMLTG